MWLDWLVSVTVVFCLSALWWRRIRALWKLPDGRDWLRGKLGLVLTGGAMLSKSLIQFFLMSGAVFPPCCLTWDQTMVEMMKIIATSFKKSHAHTAALSAPDPAAGHHWPTPLLETPGHTGKSGSVSCEKISFHSNPKERKCQRMFKLPHNCTHLTH